MKKLIVLLILAKIPFALSAQGFNPVKLALKQDKIYNLTVTSKEELSQQTKGKPTRIITNSMVMYYYKVMAITEEETTFDIWFERYQSESVLFPSTVQMLINTDLPASAGNYIGRLVNAMSKKPVTMILNNKTGKVITTKGAEKLFETIVDEIKPEDDFDVVDMGNYMSNVILKNYLDLLEGIAAICCGRETAAWTTDTRLGIISETYVPYTITGNAEIVKQKSNYTDINVSSDISSVDTSVDMGGMIVKYDVSGKYSMKGSFSQEGWLRSADVKTSINGNVVSESSQIPISIEVTTKIKVL